MKLWTILFLSCVSEINCDKIYNYYELAIQKWCSEDYMIHGLWPQIDSEHYPTYCENVEYIVPTGDLLQSMNTYWRGCDDSLWEHEWEKHGSCVKSQGNITESDFFNNTLQLFQSYKYLIDKVCNTNDDNCILGCFDLDYNYFNLE
uniref:Uncharacterized protein n=1 Tax=viral metagenome TaxID=1070528 RepID=A0A6C0KWL4_9ZZZZ|tara:strand:+ start:22313 stop:22750 length:438 start_codon:yes stop_codon:yes gene_type:complete